jgi:hopene-associated glycosyltransferase HpnB
LTFFATLLGALTCVIWLVLLAGRGGFWRAAERDTAFAALPAPASWPDVTAIVPARDEAETIAACVTSLLRQDYAGRLTVAVVDDGSTDGTADIARTAAEALGAGHRLTVIAAGELKDGWTGKLNAMRSSVEAVAAGGSRPDYLLFTDADIAWQAPDALSNLMRGAVARGSVLTSLMVKLRCDSPAERWLVPAFVFFFMKLYPFAWVGAPHRRTAAAAGGVMLVKREALQAAGGLEAIRAALIDDCALGKLMKRQGPIWLGLTEKVVSLRPYPAFADLRRMIVRSAYAELRYSPLRLLGAVAGMVVTYLAPPLLALAAGGPAAALGLIAWLMLAGAYCPMLAFYGLSPWRALALPLIAAAYTALTVESAMIFHRGRGGAWKGRYQAARGEAV